MFGKARHQQWLRLSSACAIAAVTFSAAGAQGSGDTKQGAEGAAADAPPARLLGGPKVDDRDAPPTLVMREFDGALRLVDGDPEEEALRRLDLSSEQTAALDAAAAERMSIFDRTLREHYGLITELAGGFQALEPAKRREIMRTVSTAFAEWSRFSVLKKLRGHLSEEQLKEAQRMVNEYHAAHRQAVGDAIGENTSPLQIELRIRLEVFGQEIRRSIERQVMVNAGLFDQLLADLGVDAEQEAKIRAIVQPFAVKQFQNLDTPADRMQLFREIRAILSPEQQRQLQRFLAGRTG